VSIAYQKEDIIMDINFTQSAALKGVIHSFDMTTKAIVHDIHYLEDV
jgi:hypothetical protein